MGTEIEQKTEEAVPAEAPSSLEQQIIRQIEYYFGNYNLTRDKFLREQLKLDDGWVPLETMVKFNRLKKLSEDFDVIATALKKSPQQLMEVNEDCTKIRRRTAAPLPEDYSKSQEELLKRTLYVKGFKRTNTLDELLEFFKDYQVENIYMRKYNSKNSKHFKGSVFATFETREAAEKFLETKGIKYCGTDLLKEWRTDYMKRKDEEYSKIRSEKEKKIMQKEQQKAKEVEECIKTAEMEMVPGCLLKIVNLTEDIMREHILEVFEPLGSVQYIDYSKGKPTAVLRFEEAEAKDVLEKVLKDGETVKIASCQATVSLIEGDEEKEYWKNLAIFRHQRKKMSKDKHRGHRNFPNQKRNFGNRQRRNKQDDNENDKEDESNEPPQKKEKVETSEAKDEKNETPQKKEKVETSEAKGEKNETPQKKEKVETSEANGKTDEIPQKRKIETSEVSDEKDDPPQKKKKKEISESASEEKKAEP